MTVLKAIRRGLRWLWLHWHIPVFAIIGVIGFIAGARAFSPRPMSKATDELKAIDEGEKARLLELQRGRNEANAAADLEYRRELDAMDARQKRKADRLRGDPARRARFLARVSSKRPGDAI